MRRLLGIGLLSLALMGCKDYANKQYWKDHDKVQMYIEHINGGTPLPKLDVCPSIEFPLMITVINSHKYKTVSRIDFIITARQPGHSTDLTDITGAQRVWVWDMIIPPNTKQLSCWTRPKLSGEGWPDSLEWSINVGYITYQD